MGSVYAVSSFGSIIGTFLAGYLLIPLLEVSMIIYLIAGTLAVIALGMGLRVLSAAWLSAVCLIFFFAGNVSPFPGTPAQVYEGSRGERILYAAHSKYAHISVREEERRGTRIRTLVMDGLVHNMYDPGRPDELLSSYLRRRYRGIHEVVELDPRVIDVARRYFDLRTGPDLRVYAADARSYVNNVMGERTYHLVYLDAFNSFSVPSHLTTREFTERLRNGEGYLTDDHAPVENLMAPVFLSTIE